MEELQILEIEATFTALVNQWHEKTCGISSTNQISMHLAYLQGLTGNPGYNEVACIMKKIIMVEKIFSTI